MARKPPAAKSDLVAEATEDIITGQTDLLPLPENGHGQIHTAIANAMKDVQAIVKVKQGSVSYKFRSIDDVMNALHPVLTKHNIFVVPFIETIQNNMFEQDRYGTGNQSNTVIGKRNLFQTILTCYYRFYTVDGSYLEAKVAAESSDYSDKATQQALSYCFKIALLQTFCIPTVDTTDGDERQPDMTGTKTPPAQPAQSRLSNLPSIADRPPVSQIGVQAPNQELPPAVQSSPPQNVVQMPPQQAPPPAAPEPAPAAPAEDERGDVPNEAAISFLELMTEAAWTTLKNTIMPYASTEQAFQNWVKATLISNNIEVPKPTIYWLEKKHGRFLYEVAVASTREVQLLHALPEGFVL